MEDNELDKNIIKNDKTDIQNDAIDSKSSIPQAQTSSNSSSFKTIEQLISFLDKIDSKTKIKIKILDFNSFRQFLSIAHKYTSKFEIFRYVTEFEVISNDSQEKEKKETINFKESFTNWLKNQKIDSKIIEILQKEIE